MSDGPRPGAILQLWGRPYFLAWTYHDPDYIADIDPMTWMQVIQHYVGTGAIKIMPIDDDFDIEFIPDEEGWDEE